MHFVRTDRQSERYSERIQAELGPVIGQPLDPAQIDERLSHFYGSDNFEALDYRLVREGVLTGIEVERAAQELGAELPALRPRAAGRLPGRQQLQRRRARQVTEVNRYGAEWQTDLQVGENPLLRTEFYQPIGYTSNWFVVPRLLVERQNFDIFEDDERLATYRVRNSEVELDFGREFGSWGELRGGLVRGEGNRDLLVGDPDRPGPAAARRISSRGEFIARFSVDLLDDVYFPAPWRALHAAMECAARGPRRRRRMRIACPSTGRTRARAAATR